MPLTRRDALKLAAVGGLSARLSAELLPFRAAWAQEPTAPAKAIPDLALIKGPDPAKNVRAAVAALGGMSRFVSKGDKVAIKPNMGFGNAPEKATTTDPRVIRALAELALEAGAKRVMVFDNPCHKADVALGACGVAKAVEGLDDTYAFTITRDNFFREVAIPRGKALKKAAVAVDILDADCVINAPVAKSHGSAKVSFGMKNWMGAVLDRRYWHVAVNLHQAIADMATFIRPKLTLLDATRALVTGGPGGPGRIDALDTVLAGVNPVSVDAYGLTLAPYGGKGYKPQDIPFLVYAAEHQLGSLDISTLNVFKKTV